MYSVNLRNNIAKKSEGVYKGVFNKEVLRVYLWLGHRSSNNINASMLHPSDCLNLTRHQIMLTVPFKRVALTQDTYLTHSAHDSTMALTYNVFAHISITMTS